MSSDFLAWLRQSCFMTQRGLASKAGISTSYLRKLESGQRQINRGLELKLRKALGIDEERFLRFQQMYVEVRSIANTQIV